MKLEISQIRLKNIHISNSIKTTNCTAVDTRTKSNCRKWICWYTGQKGCQNYTNTF